MANYILVSLGGGILLGVLDGVINANPLARRLYEVYKPIARTSLNPVAGIFIDLAYGFVMAALFLLLYKGLPGASGWMKGLSFGLIAWFFRVLMSVASQWIMYRVPPAALLYTLLAGLAEMLIVGSLFGLTLRPRPKFSLRNRLALAASASSAKKEEMGVVPIPSLFASSPPPRFRGRARGASRGRFQRPPQVPTT